MPRRHDVLGEVRPDGAPQPPRRARRSRRNTRTPVATRGSLSWAFRGSGPLRPLARGRSDVWDLPALYTGRKASLEGSNDWMRVADVILLSQSWEDHCHKPTLRELPKDIPVVGSPAAVEVAKELGFSNATPLKANAQVRVRPRGDTDEAREGALSIVAVAGALVGPPWSTREAGFILADGSEGARVYYEPHCSYVPESVKAGLRAVGGRVDCVVTPVRSVDVVGFPLVSGGASRGPVKCLNRPGLVIPLRNGELKQDGVSAGLLGRMGPRGGVRGALRRAFRRGQGGVRMLTPGSQLTFSVRRKRVLFESYNPTRREWAGSRRCSEVGGLENFGFPSPSSPDAVADPEGTTGVAGTLLRPGVTICALCVAAL